MLNRRTLLRGKLGLPFLGTWLGRGRAAAAKPRRDFFQELNVHPFINAAEPFTALSSPWRNSRTPLTDVRGSVDSARYRAATVRERFHHGLLADP